MAHRERPLGERAYLVALILILGCANATGVGAQAPASANTIRAVRVTDASPHLDGKLIEPVWQSAPAATGLVQREPNEGSPAIENTEVRFAYDDDALYIAARMFSNDPRAIRALVTRRDHEGSSEQIVVSLDTYHDRRTAYTFSANPAGVRIDYVHTSDAEGDRDYGFDPVWAVSTRVDSLGWTAEMRIPFAQLRFSPSDVQEWGLNVVRLVPTRNEQSYWQLVRRSETGWSSRMGTLAGIRGIKPSRRIEAIPYVAANSRYTRVEDPADPFQHATDGGLRAGGDLKLGLGPNLTLDLAVNPDFGQVEADPAVVNLTAYEIFFDEKRPFFTEGSDLLERRGLFYSRRIGAPPPGNAGADFAEQRSNTTILGAAKLTGRLESGLSIAALSAVTDEETVRTFDAGSQQFGTAVVAPRTAFAAASVQQEFGENASTLQGMLTVVHRELDSGTPLANLLVRNAVSGIGEGRLRWADGEYDINAWLGMTDIRGDSAAIMRQQRSSRRYWQRPDLPRLNPELRSLVGATFGIGHSKLAGKHWLWDVDYKFETPAFEPNDMGAFGAVDNRYLNLSLRWRQTQPAQWYRNYTVGLSSENTWSYRWMRRDQELGGFANFTFKNFWRLDSDVWVHRRAFSDRLTRGGPIMATPMRKGGALELRNRAGARNRWQVEWNVESDENGGWARSFDVNTSARPGDRWEVSFDPEWLVGEEATQYVATMPGGSGSTFFSRYIFAHVDVNEISGRLRVNYTFTPNLTLETYAEPFASSGRFYSYGELVRDGARDMRLYGASGTGSTIIRNADGSHTVTDNGSTFDIEPQDFNVRSFRSNVVLRWEWRPGSTMYLVWQQDRSGDRPIARARPSDLLDALNTQGNNFLALKISYWTTLR